MKRLACVRAVELVIAALLLVIIIISFAIAVDAPEYIEVEDGRENTVEKVDTSSVEPVEPSVKPQKPDIMHLVDVSVPVIVEEVEEDEDEELVGAETSTESMENEVEEVEVLPVEVDPVEVDLLACVIYQEAGSDACSDETRQMVGEVVLNRVASECFPNTLEEVLLQERQYGRYHWTGVVWPDRASCESETHAVERARRIAQDLLSGESERLLPEDVLFQAEFPQNVEIVAFADGIYFCR